MLGIATAIPVAYPSEPYYWFALLVALFGIVASRPPRERVVLLLVYVAIGSASTLLTEYQHFASLERSLPIALGSVLVIAGFGFQDQERFLRGYCYAMTVWAILVIAGYFQLGVYLDTWQAFIYPEKRLWGEPYFPDWPNFLAFGLGLAAVISVCILRLNVMGALCLLASVMTTSRMALVALVVLAVVWLRDVSKNHGSAAVLAIAVGLLVAIWLMLWDLAVALAGSLDAVVATGYIDRLFKLGDRSVIWLESMKIFAQNPLLGIGAIPLDESIGLSSSSIHNSYLEVTIRYGILGLLAWIFLFLPTAQSLRQHKGLLSVFLFIAISAFFNNVLRHPHYLIMYGVLLALGPTFASGARAAAIKSSDHLRHQE